MVRLVTEEILREGFFHPNFCREGNFNFFSSIDRLKKQDAFQSFEGFPSPWRGWKPSFQPPPCFSNIVTECGSQRKPSLLTLFREVTALSNVPKKLNISKAIVSFKEIGPADVA